MITRIDMNEPGDMLHRVKIELVTDKHWEKMHAYVYPNYDEDITIKMNTPGLGFTMSRDHARNLIEVLDAALRACE